MEFERRSTSDAPDSAVTMSRRKSRMLIASQLPGDNYSSPTTKNETTITTNVQDEFEKTVTGRLFKDAGVRA